MLANLCVESHMRELIEQRFEVAVVRDATATPKNPELGDGYPPRGRELPLHRERGLDDGRGRGGNGSNGAPPIAICVMFSICYGFTALGAKAGELFAVVQTAMLAGAAYMSLRDAILTHPTIAGGLTVLFANAPAEPNARPE